MEPPTVKIFSLCLTGKVIILHWRYYEGRARRHQSWSRNSSNFAAVTQILRRYSLLAERNVCETLEKESIQRQSELNFEPKPTIICEQQAGVPVRLIYMYWVTAVYIIRVEEGKRQAFIRRRDCHCLGPIWPACRLMLHFDSVVHFGGFRPGQPWYATRAYPLEAWLKTIIRSDSNIE